MSEPEGQDPGHRAELRKKNSLIRALRKKQTELYRELDNARSEARNYRRLYLEATKPFPAKPEPITAGVWGGQQGLRAATKERLEHAKRVP